MTPAFKTPEEALTYLKDVKAIAVYGMSHPTITPEVATGLYAKYGKTIDMLINLGGNFATNQDALKRHAEALEKYTPGVVARAGTNVGGKTLAVFGSIGMVLTAGLAADWRDIGDAWTGPSEMNSEIMAASKKVQKEIAVFEQASGNVHANYAALVSGMVSGDDTKMEQSYTRLNGALTTLQKEYKTLESAVHDLSLRSTYFEGALGVVKDFALQAGITVATMGLTEVGIHLAGKVAAKYAPRVIAYAAEHSTTAAAVAGGLAAVRTAPKVVTTVRGAGTVVKSGYELSHGVEGLEGRLENDRKFAEEHAP